MKPQSSLSFIPMRQNSKQCHFVSCIEVVQEKSSWSKELHLSKDWSKELHVNKD